MKQPQMKRGKSTYVNKSEHPLHKFVTVPSSGNKPLQFGWAYTSSMIAAVAADLTTVAELLVCTYVIAGVEALALESEGDGLGLGLELVAERRRRQWTICRRFSPPRMKSYEVDLA